MHGYTFINATDSAIATVVPVENFNYILQERLPAKPTPPKIFVGRFTIETPMVLAPVTVRTNSIIRTLDRSLNILETIVVLATNAFKN